MWRCEAGWNMDGTVKFPSHAPVSFTVSAKTCAVWFRHYERQWPCNQQGLAASVAVRRPICSVDLSTHPKWWYCLGEEARKGYFSSQPNWKHDCFPVKTFFEDNLVYGAPPMITCTPRCLLQSIFRFLSFSSKIDRFLNFSSTNFRRNSLDEVIIIQLMLDCHRVRWRNYFEKKFFSIYRLGHKIISAVMLCV